jgi:hypothetical protein
MSSFSASQLSALLLQLSAVLVALSEPDCLVAVACISPSPAGINPTTEPSPDTGDIAPDDGPHLLRVARGRSHLAHLLPHPDECDNTMSAVEHIKVVEKIESVDDYQRFTVEFSV